MNKMILMIFFASLSCFPLGWDFLYNPYKIMDDLQQNIKGSNPYVEITSFHSCYYVNKTGIEFLRSKIGSRVDFLRPDRKLYPGDKTYHFFIVDSRDNERLLDVTISCIYGGGFSGKAHFCHFTDIKNMTDNEQYPNIPVCADL